MAKRTSVFDDLVEMTALLPWWVGVVLAIASYLVLHAVAGQPIAPSKAPGDVVGTGLWKAFATAGQYLLPFVFGLGAVLSAIKRHKRKALVGHVEDARSPNALNDMSWQEFEGLVAEAFTRRGFVVQERGGSKADGGVDLVLRKGADKYLVQCKQWRASKVGVVPVRELFGVMAAHGAAGGYLVTSGSFTDEAQAFASGRHLELVDGRRLFDMIREVRSSPSRRPAPPAVDRKSPDCPRCGSSMLRRTAQMGANAGKYFWGCGTFPKCRGTRPL